MALAVFVVGMLALGMGNGAVFQLVPQRFRDEIGVMTGLVGMAGGIGGFYLASSLGYSKQLTGSYQAGFLVFAALALVAFSERKKSLTTRRSSAFRCSAIRPLFGADTTGLEAITSNALISLPSRLSNSVADTPRKGFAGTPQMPATKARAAGSAMLR